MERYTYFDGGKWRLRIGDTEYSGETIERLAAYEDTRLEPKEVAKMAAEWTKYETAMSYVDEIGINRLRELSQADREKRCVVLDMPRKSLVWGDDEKNTCLCPCCGRDLMGIPYGERMVLQCPECGQYLDDTKVISYEEAAAELEGMKND